MPGGAGLCRLPDGSVGFVEGAFPGDVVRPLELVRKKDFARATRFELVTPSPERALPVCPVVDACGGCDWMKLERSAELREKSALVAQALERTGGVRLASPPAIVTAGSELAYRSRVRLQVDAGGRVGFHARGTHTLVEVPGCPVAEPEVERGIIVVQELAKEAPRSLARFESVEVRAREEGGLAFVVCRRDERGAAAAPGEGLVLERLRRHGSVTVSPRGADFSQVNRAVNAALVAHVERGATDRGARTFLDLYGGSGNFAVPLARTGMAGVLVESDASAAGRARERAASEGLRVEVLAKDVARALGDLERKGRRFDVALLDPPRTGAKGAIPGLVALEPPAIAYVACDPVTLARDVRILVEKGWNVADVTCFDMFPKTHHVETVVWLERSLR
ncbi:MAG TPA: RsmD family RNA methyltransferase [Polyangiaceae bacterium]